MYTYTCTKCNEVCEVEESEDHPGYAESWCDTCNDYPGGWTDFDKSGNIPASSIGADMMADRVDRAHDEHRERQLFNQASKSEREAVTRTKA